MSVTQIKDGNIVSLDASKLTGNLPAISGASLTGVVGKIVQVVSVQDGLVDTGTTLSPADDTIPQNTEGNEFFTLAITPTSATNKLRIDVTIQMAHSAAGTFISAALFQDSIANALASSGTTEAAANYDRNFAFSHYMTSGTVSAITFKVRGGGHQAGTTTFNGSGATQKHGGVYASTIIITEIAV